MFLPLRCFGTLWSFNGFDGFLYISQFTENHASFLPFALEGPDVQKKVQSYVDVLTTKGLTDLEVRVTEAWCVRPNLSKFLE